MGTTIRALQNALGMLSDAWLRYCKTFSDADQAEVVKWTREVDRWNRTLQAEADPLMPSRAGWGGPR